MTKTPTPTLEHRFPRILRIQSYLFLLIFITEIMIILLYIAQLVVLFDDSVLSNSWMIDLLALFGINPGSGKTKDWVSSTRGILPAASLFIFVWHQAFQRKLMYENNEFSNLTAHLKEMAEKKKEPKDKEEKPERPRSRKISDVAEFLMEQEKRKASRQETRTNVFMTFLITLLTTWRRPLRWTIQVVVYALILWGTLEMPGTKWLKVFNMGWRILLCILPLGLTFEPSTESTRRKRRSSIHVTLVWMYFVAFYCAVNISFFYIMMMYPFPYEANRSMNFIQEFVDDSWMYFEEHYYGVENATGFFTSLNLVTPASTLTFTDLNKQCGRSIIIFVLCSVYCSIDSAVQAEFRRSHKNKEKLDKKRTSLDRCGQYFKEFLAYTAEFVCTWCSSVSYRSLILRENHSKINVRIHNRL